MSRRLSFSLLKLGARDTCICVQKPLDLLQRRDPESLVGFPGGSFKERQVYPACLARMKRGSVSKRPQREELIWTSTVELCVAEGRSPALGATRVSCSKASAMVYIDSRCSIDRV